MEQEKLNSSLALTLFTYGLALERVVAAIQRNYNGSIVFIASIFIASISSRVIQLSTSKKLSSELFQFTWHCKEDSIKGYLYLGERRAEGCHGTVSIDSPYWRPQLVHSFTYHSSVALKHLIHTVGVS